MSKINFAPPPIHLFNNMLHKSEKSKSEGVSRNFFKKLSTDICAIILVFCLSFSVLNAQITSVPSSPICLGTSITLTAHPAVTYSWSSTPSGASGTTQSITESPTVNTLYFCNGFNLNIIVNPLPAANAGSNASICTGNSATIGATAVGGHTYSWASSPSGYSSTVAKPTVSPTVTTTYTLTERITSTGCTKLNSVVITVYSAVTASSSTIYMCPNTGTAEVSLSGSVGGGSGNFSYSFYDASSNHIGTNTSGLWTYAATNTYNYTVTDITTGCSASSSFTISSSPVPIISVGGLVGPVLSWATAPSTALHPAHSGIGYAGTIAFTVTNASDFTYFQWYKDGQPISGAYGSTMSSYAPVSFGDYQVMCIPDIVTLPCASGTVYTFSAVVPVQIGPGSLNSYYDTVSFYNSTSCTPKAITMNTIVVNAFKFGNIDIQSGTLIIDSTADIIMSAGTSIVVEPGAELIIHAGAVIHSCSTWNGIIVEGSSGYQSPPYTYNPGILQFQGPNALYFTWNSTIEDAAIAVLAYDDAFIDIENAAFVDNGAHIVEIPSGSLPASGANTTISFDSLDCVFSTPWLAPCSSGWVTSPPLIQPTINGTPMLYFSNIGLGATTTYFVSGCSFTGNIASGGLSAVTGLGAYDMIANYGTNDIWGNDFVGFLQYGVYLNNTATGNAMNTTIGATQNYFQQVINTAIYAADNAGTNSGLVINSCIFGNSSPITFPWSFTIAGFPVNDVILQNVDRAEMENCSLQYYKNGLEYLGLSGTGSTNTSITQNYFKGANAATSMYPDTPCYGIVIAPSVYPIEAPGSINIGSAINTSTSAINVNLTCNGIEENTVGLIGSGNLINQGISTIGPGNLFGSSTTGHENISWDILWLYSGTHPSYFYDNIYSPNPNAGSWLTLGTQELNYTEITSPSSNSDMTISAATGHNTSCSTITLYKKEPASIEQNKADSNSINAYPNPFNSGFSVDLTKEKNITFVMEVTDMAGRNILLKNVQGGQIISIDAETWPQGTYILNLSSEDGQYYHSILVKVKE